MQYAEGMLNEQEILFTMEDNHDGAFTVDGFCRKYGIGRTAFDEEVTAGRLKAKKRGTRTMIERAEARKMVCQSAPS